MARRPETYQAAITNVIKEMEKSGRYTKKSIISYRTIYNATWKILDEIKPGVMPHNLDRDTAMTFVSKIKNYAVSTQSAYIQAVKRLCEKYDNNVFSTMLIPMQNDPRVNVNWLTHEQAVMLINCDKTPLEGMIVELELMHGLRCVEVLRMKLDDIKDGYFIVRGKGHVGGKLRSIPMHNSFNSAYSRWMNHRRSIIADVERMTGEYVEDPGYLLIYKNGKKIHNYETVYGCSIRNQIGTLSSKLGFKFSNHTLRRTFGREMYRSGVGMPTIAKLLGHESTDMTMRYLGLDLDDMSAAMSAYSLG